MTLLKLLDNSHDLLTSRSDSFELVAIHDWHQATLLWFLSHVDLLRWHDRIGISVYILFLHSGKAHGTCGLLLLLRCDICRLWLIVSWHHEWVILLKSTAVNSAFLDRSLGLRLIFCTKVVHIESSISRRLHWWSTIRRSSSCVTCRAKKTRISHRGSVCSSCSLPSRCLANRWWAKKPTGLSWCRFYSRWGIGLG